MGQIRIIHPGPDENTRYQGPGRIKSLGNVVRNTGEVNRPRLPPRVPRDDYDGLPHFPEGVRITGHRESSSSPPQVRVSYLIRKDWWIRRDPSSSTRIHVLLFLRWVDLVNNVTLGRLLTKCLRVHSVWPFPIESFFLLIKGTDERTKVNLFFSFVGGTW